MYSPIIREDLIPQLYRMGQDMQKPMTQVVDGILREYVTLYNNMTEIGRKEMMPENLPTEVGTAVVSAYEIK